ncbi:response regulator [Dyadobacter chenhuakuii]|uniref:Response regulator n=1 Tax=Dyadobacter chenhuakuii TaxID=2909339 RepID=A0A9X1QID7_9BACT|nr:response regulator [Dyadobacter chenhuakuii]MCF2496532.1 response regulator [Dyadobacter chenhuakuii]MCF2501576.1 response regulator [Dyadobacter chenhuakuii]USJ30589.1 response regulator [Dyadobacter chenhuakuii]
MDKNGPIIIIEDDPDDKFVLEEVFCELGYPNPRMYFTDGQSALDYLYTSKDLPFIIISDINLPQLNGLELRRKVQTDAELSLKCIPYVYFTTAINQQVVIDAYSTSAQGFFVKPGEYDEVKATIKVMIDYWKRCAAPNNF